ncbi:MAG: 50S ribosomal protein L9 [Candidatus Omnitrophota bacterium]|jgi:large subunit ribosomal protein L9|nr:50S ribosomal protein L9 [Candidatus Omnitrophota bacterium]MDD3983873.1 50S ribosomal protein L9 [Candidatus Omnitrophota bacterium]MDD5526124.1 50S ribosomal protein L9 [Candidatus Omnitrophota bacterium]
MKVILTDNIEKVGKLGAMVNVKDGFARNFLFPRKLAVPSTPGNLKALEAKMKKKAKELEALKNEAEKTRTRLEALSLTMPVLTQEDDKLYAGISSVDILQALKDEGIILQKSDILLEEPIRALGIYEVPVKLHPEVEGKVKVWVVKK